MKIAQNQIFRKIQYTLTCQRRANHQISGQAAKQIQEADQARTSDENIEYSITVYKIIDYLIKGNGIIYGTFVYTPDFELLSYRLDPS